MLPSGPRSQALTPPQISRYRCLRLLGRGGFSAVYLARDDELNRTVALKVMRGRYETDAWARARLHFEAEVAAGLEHPGVVPVYNLGKDDCGNAYFTMRYIQGDNLQVAVWNGRHAPTPAERLKHMRRLIDRLVDVCYTAAFAHEHGIIHRDLTPSNIMLGRHGETLVVDWGLARWIGAQGPDPGLDGSGTTASKPGGGPEDEPDEARVPAPGWPASRETLTPTRMGESVGTPRFMSPEQASGRWNELGPATDVFGLGTTLYYVLTGEAPFDDDDERVSLRKARRGECRAPRSIDRRVPAALESVCLKAMMHDPRARYASPIELGEDLARWLEGEPVSVTRRSTLRAWARQAIDPPLRSEIVG